MSVMTYLHSLEGWEGTFFKSPRRTTGNTLLGSCHRMCGMRFQHSLESKAGEDSEWSAFSSTLSTQRVDRTFLQEWGGPSLAPSRNADSCHLFLQTIGGIILASPHDNLGGLSSSISSKARMGRGPWLSPTMWRGFLKRQWAHSAHKKKWYEDCYGIKLLPKKHCNV